MSKKIIMPISLVLLFGFVVFVSALTDQDNIDVSVNVEEGWNLVSNGIFAINPSQDSEIQREDISAIYFYDSKENKYKLVFPLGSLSHEEEEEIEDVIMKEVAPAVWIYSEKKGSLKFTTDDVVPLNRRPLYAGWNFVSITPSMDGKFLKDINGKCNIELAYTFDITSKKWVRFSLSDQYFGDYDIGRGIIIKVQNNCSLSSQSNYNSPDNIPSLPESFGFNCSDSDNGKDYYTKGAITKGSSRGSDECNTNRQFGSNPNLLREYFCNSNDEIDAEWYACSGTCEDGRCINSSSSIEGCEDSDNGKDYYTKGIAHNSTYSDSDHCTFVQNEDYYYIFEVYCEDNAVKSEQVNCTNGCSNGACVN